MTKNLTKIALLAFITTAFSTVPAVAETLKYSGSDFLAGNLEKSMKEGVVSKNPSIELEGDLIGSKSGAENLRKGTADFALLMLPDKNEIPEIKDKKWRAIPLAYQVTYVVVSRTNPIESLTFYDLSSIFARFSESHVELWEKLPNYKGEVTGKILAIAGTEATNTAATFFQSLVFPRSDFHKDVRLVKSDDLILRELSNTYSGIAIVGTPLTSMNPALKTIAISNSKDKDKSGTPYTPTGTNIYNEDYPLSIPIYVVYPAENSQKLLPVLGLLFSKPFSETLRKSVFMPLPENIRQSVEKNIDEMSKK